jgi:hypothetical protein
MDPKIIGAFGLLCLCSISSSIAASMSGGEETPVTGAGAGAAKKDETFTVPTDADSLAECYVARYWDLRATFGTDKAQAKNHYTTYTTNGPETRDNSCTLSDAEAQCYLDRYPAVQAYAGTNLKLARKHYYEVGMSENKDFTCPPGVTELKCYGERYQDLQDSFGTDTVKLGRHWVDFGKGENRDFSCP